MMNSGISAMQTGSDSKAESMGAIVRNALEAPVELKHPVAQLLPVTPGMSRMPKDMQVKVLVRRNLALARDLVAIENEKKETVAEKLSNVISALAQCHVLPWTDSDDNIIPILLHPNLSAVWHLQNEIPEFAQPIGVPLWEQLWQLRWGQLNDYKQSLRVRYSGGAAPRGVMSVCDSLTEAASYSQELLLREAEMCLPSTVQLNAQNCCVYEVDNKLVVVFRRISTRIGFPGMRLGHFFCIPLDELRDRVKLLHQHFEQGCTEYALKRFAASCRPEEFSVDALLHQFVATSIIVQTNANLQALRKEKKADSMHAIHYSNVMHDLLTQKDGHWLTATHKLVSGIICNPRGPECDPAIDSDTVVRLWIQNVLKFIVPSLVYRWCTSSFIASKRLTSGDLLIKWRRLMSALCNALITGVYQLDDPSFFGWAPDSYITLLYSK